MGPHRMSGMADGRIVGQADRLREGEPVEYLSKTHGRWVSAFVERVHSDGSVSLDIKPRADPSRVRRRAWRVGERVEYNSRSRGGWIAAGVFIGVVLIVSGYYLPLWRGDPIPYDLWRLHMWLPTWI